MSNPTPFSPSLRDRLRLIQERIRAAAYRSGRPEDSVHLVAVTKTVSVPVIQEAIEAGVIDVGESKVQEAVRKWPPLTQDVERRRVRRHFLGHLQSNKARTAVALFDWIQSVDRMDILSVLERRAAEQRRTVQCLLQIKIAEDAAKTGFSYDAASEAMARWGEFPHLTLQGLMTIGGLNVSEAETRTSFRRLRTFFETHQRRFGSQPVLSMGMSDDFEIAIEEGSTMVRVGRALFGERTERRT